MNRFWSKVKQNESGCLIWTASKVNGYGRFRVQDEDRTEYAHRYAWYLATGAYPLRGLHLDHLCRNVSCVNVKHLEIVTPKINVARGKAGSKIVCHQGHLMTETNSRYESDGNRHCKTCAKKPRGLIRPHLTQDQNKRIGTLLKSGLSHQKIAEMVGCSRMTVARRER